MSEHLKVRVSSKMCPVGRSGCERKFFGAAYDSRGVIEFLSKADSEDDALSELERQVKREVDRVTEALEAIQARRRDGGIVEDAK